MSSRRVVPSLLFYLGAICILLALAGGGLLWVQGKRKDSLPLSGNRATKKVEQTAPPTSNPPKSIPRPRPTSPVQAESTLSASAPAGPPQLSEVERKKEMTRLLLARIAQTPDRLDSAWFDRNFQYIRNSIALQSYYDTLLALGEQRFAAYREAQRSAKKAVAGDPRYFLNLARKGIYAKSPSQADLEKEGRDNLAMALYREREEKQGLENADEAFISSFFKEMRAIYEALQQLAVKSGEDPQPWFVERLKIQEAAAMDRFLRIARNEKRMREKKEGLQPGVLLDGQRVDMLNKALNESLLYLGKLYAQAAKADSLDRERMQSYADRAFATLAMVYQRIQSGDALGTLRQLSDIQQRDLYRLARINWRKAQLAAKQGDRQQAEAQYLLASRQYQEYLVTLAGAERAKVEAELAQLREEMAYWQARQRSESVSQGRKSAGT